MKYCVYLTIYKGVILPRRYIGSTSVVNVNKGYNGSVKSKRYSAMYTYEQTYNKHLFKTRILKRFILRKEALQYEKELQIKYDVVRSNNYMNESIAAENGCFGRNVDGVNHPFYGKMHTEETKKVLSEKVKLAHKEGRLVSRFIGLHPAGELNPFYGKTHTEESLNKMRKPKKHVPKYNCPHCNKHYDGGNLKQHLVRNGYAKEFYSDHCEEWKIE